MGKWVAELVIQLGQGDLDEALRELLELLDSADLHEVLEHCQLQEFLLRSNIFIFVVAVELELLEDLLSEDHVVLYQYVPHLELINIQIIFSL